MSIVSTLLGFRSTRQCHTSAISTLRRNVPAFRVRGRKLGNRTSRQSHEGRQLPKRHLQYSLFNRLVGVMLPHWCHPGPVRNPSGSNKFGLRFKSCELWLLRFGFYAPTQVRSVNYSRILFWSLSLPLSTLRRIERETFGRLTSPRPPESGREVAGI